MPEATLVGHFLRDSAALTPTGPQGIPHMKTKTHPSYDDCQVTCGCGNSFSTRATVKELKIEICNVCHPFYSGKQKFVDAAGRVDRFRKKYGDVGSKKKE
jgi:large subunit ribosomal protein L31